MAGAEKWHSEEADERQAAGRNVTQNRHSFPRTQRKKATLSCEMDKKGLPGKKKMLLKTQTTAAEMREQNPRDRHESGRGRREGPVSTPRRPTGEDGGAPGSAPSLLHF